MVKENPLNNPIQQDRHEGLRGIINNLRNQSDPLREKMDEIPDNLKP